MATAAERETLLVGGETAGGVTTTTRLRLTTMTVAQLIELYQKQHHTERRSKATLAYHDTALRVKFLDFLSN